MPDARYDTALFDQLPDHMQESLQAYIEDHRPVGHFLSAVLTNNLREAVARGDAENLDALVAYVRWLYNYAPAACWGSPERVRAWLGEEA